MSARTFSPPHVVIYVCFEERRPRIFKCCSSEGDQHRLELWLDDHPDLEDLVGRALELSEQEPAA